MMLLKNTQVKDTERNGGVDLETRNSTIKRVHGYYLK